MQLTEHYSIVFSLNNLIKAVVVTHTTVNNMSICMPTWVNNFRGDTKKLQNSYTYWTYKIGHIF